MNNLNKQQNLDDENQISLKEILLQLAIFWVYIKTKKIILFLAFIIGIIVGLAYSYLKKPIYKAELSFALEDEKASGGNIGSALGLASQLGFDLGGSGGGAFSGDNLLVLMKSRSMVEKTLLTPININGSEKTLAELYIDFNGLRNEWNDDDGLKDIHFLPGVNRVHFTLKQDSLLGEFQKTIIEKNLSVEKIDKKLSVILVTVNSKNQLFSKYFTEILVSTVSKFYIETKTKKANQNVKILQHQTDSVRNQLSAAIRGVANAVDNNPNANPLLQILRAPSQNRQVDVQANTAILTELVKNLEVSKVSLRKETPLIQMIDTPILPLEKQRVSKTKGMVIGGAIFFFVAFFYFLLKKLLEIIMA